jgi:3-phosphoshikimate 1-carboxyvinyltransferase
MNRFPPPMARIITPLEMMEVKITSQNGGRPPLHVTKFEGHWLQPAGCQRAGEVNLMFAGLFAEGETSVTEPIHTRDHGEMRQPRRERPVGKPIAGQGPPCARSSGNPWRHLSAAFFLCATALPRFRTRYRSLLMNPTRARLLDILILLRRISVLNWRAVRRTGTVKAQGRKLGTIAITGSDTAHSSTKFGAGAIALRAAQIRDAREPRVGI